MVVDGRRWLQLKIFLVAEEDGLRKVFFLLFPVIGKGFPLAWIIVPPRPSFLPKEIFLFLQRVKSYGAKTENSEPNTPCMKIK